MAYFDTSNVEDIKTTLERSDQTTEDSLKRSKNNNPDNNDMNNENAEYSTQKEARTESYKSSNDAQEWLLRRTFSKPSSKPMTEVGTSKWRFQKTITEMLTTETSPATPLPTTTQAQAVPKFKFKLSASNEMTTVPSETTLTTFSSEPMETSTIRSRKINLKAARKNSQGFQSNETQSTTQKGKKIDGEEEYIEYYDVVEYYDWENPNITLWEVKTGTTQVVKVTTDQTFSTDFSTTENPEKDSTLATSEDTNIGSTLESGKDFLAIMCLIA